MEKSHHDKFLILCKDKEKIIASKLFLLIDNSRKIFSVNYHYYCEAELHSCLLLVAGARAAVLAACRVELPCEVEHECAASWVISIDFSHTIDYSTALASVKDVVAAQVGSQCSQVSQAEVALNSQR